MTTPIRKPANIDEYISTFPPATQKLLTTIRKTIRKLAPEAEETMGYGIPTFKHHGNLVHFAAWKSHIGFYPAPSGLKAFAEELGVFVGSKGAVQFPLDKPLPLELISRIVQFRLAENEEKAMVKKSLRTCPQGHKFQKTSDCPTCPVCEADKKPTDGFLSSLSAPARRALENAGIKSPKQLASHTEKEILSLHGMGPASLPALKKTLKEAGLAFKS